MSTLPAVASQHPGIFQQNNLNDRVGEEIPRNFYSNNRTSTAHSSNVLNLSKTAPRELHSLIHGVAKRCMTELAISLAIGSVAALFTVTSLHATLIFAAIAVQTVANAGLRLAAALAAEWPETEETQRIRSASRYFCTTMFAYLTAGNAQSLIHEAGHAFSAKWLFQNANPNITLTPCLGGITRFSSTHLSTWGERFGRSNALLFVSLMGPACSLFVSSIAILVGVAVRKKFPELGYYLIAVGKGDFYAHSAYAFFAISPSPGAHANDFLRLKPYGIHPLASAAALFAIPILITKALEPPQMEQVL